MTKEYLNRKENIMNEVLLSAANIVAAVAVYFGMLIVVPKIADKASKKYRK
jgi:hypothetical protein